MFQPIVRAAIVETDDSGITVAWEDSGGAVGSVTIYIEEGTEHAPVFRCANEGFSRAFVREVVTRMLDNVVFDDQVVVEEVDLACN